MFWIEVFYFCRQIDESLYKDSGDKEKVSQDQAQYNIKNLLAKKAFNKHFRLSEEILLKFIGNYNEELKKESEF